jgi:hypothetical protein
MSHQRVRLRPTAERAVVNAVVTVVAVNVVVVVAAAAAAMVVVAVAATENAAAPSAPQVAAQLHKPRIRFRPRWL